MLAFLVGSQDARDKIPAEERAANLEKTKSTSSLSEMPTDVIKDAIKRDRASLSSSRGVMKKFLENRLAKYEAELKQR